MKIRNIIGMLCAAIIFSPSAFAAAELAPVGADNPYLKDIEAATDKLGSSLPPEALKHLYYIREGYGATRVVKIVRKDVENAVKLCGKANPDLKKDMDTEFSTWSKAVDPAVKEKEALMKQAIDQQDYIKPKEIRDYLSLIEKAGEHANKEIDKQVVTTPEACNELKESMARTQKVLVELIGDVQFLIWPLPDSETKDMSKVKAKGQ